MHFDLLQILINGFSCRSESSNNSLVLSSVLHCSEDFSYNKVSNCLCCSNRMECVTAWCFLKQLCFHHWSLLTIEITHCYMVGYTSDSEFLRTENFWWLIQRFNISLFTCSPAFILTGTLAATLPSMMMKLSLIVLLVVGSLLMGQVGGDTFIWGWYCVVYGIVGLKNCQKSGTLL